jgi:hypothetical protein
MANIVDRVFAEVCLDERIKDGIFRLEEEEHMNALRDYFLKRGITQEAAVAVTNRMVEGRFPERQAYNKDGILVTFPTPQHKAKAIARGTHFEKNPAPQNSTPPKEEPKRPDLKPTDKADDLPPKEPAQAPAPKEEPAGGVVNKVQQGGVELAVEPPRGAEKPESAPVPQAPQEPQAPRRPERIAAEKEVIKQILATDDTALNPVDPALSENSNPELEKNIREMREKIVKVVDSLPYPELKELYNRVFIKYVYGVGK